MVFKFKAPSRFLLYGPSASGKTTFLIEFIKHRMLEPWPSSITYVYSNYSEEFNHLAKEYNINFVSNFDAEDYKILSDSLLIFDDKIQELSSNATLFDEIYTQGRHKNITSMFLSQNLYAKGMRTMSINSNVVILFSNFRDQLSISTFARQVMPRNSKFLIDSYNDCIHTNKYGYLICDFSQTIDARFRFRTKIFPNDETTVYIPNETRA